MCDLLQKKCIKISKCKKKKKLNVKKFNGSEHICKSKKGNEGKRRWTSKEISCNDKPNKI